jgi:tetratricopeptide (TPR) repeat protein
MEDTSASILQRAKALFEGRRYAEAEELLRGVDSRHLSDPSIASFRAYLLYKTGKTEEAEEAYRSLAREVPDDASNLSNLGLIYFKQEKFVKARETFEKVLELHPDDRKVLRNLGFCFRRLGDEARAADFFRQAEGGETENGASRGRGRAEEDFSELVDVTEWTTSSALPLHGRGGEVFRPGPGIAVCSIDEKTYLKRSHLLAYRGVIVFSSSSREAKRAAAKFGDRASELIRAEGTGEIGLSGAGADLHFFHFSGESPMHVNFRSLVSHGPEIDVAYNYGSMVRGAFLASGLSGSGRIVLAARGTPAVLEVPRDMPVFVRARAVLGWIGELTFKTEEGPLPGRLLRRWKSGEYLLFEGRGHLLLQDVSGRAGA